MSVTCILHLSTFLVVMILHLVWLKTYHSLFIISFQMFLYSCFYLPGWGNCSACSSLIAPRILVQCIYLKTRLKIHRILNSIFLHKWDSKKVIIVLFKQENCKSKFFRILGTLRSLWNMMHRKFLGNKNTHNLTLAKWKEINK